MAGMCLQCELFDCAGCETYQALPEYGCCCGGLRPDPDESEDCGER
jgi:hypothetical protein